MKRREHFAPTRPDFEKFFSVTDVVSIRLVSSRIAILIPVQTFDLRIENIAKKKDKFVNETAS